MSTALLSRLFMITLIVNIHLVRGSYGQEPSLATRSEPAASCVLPAADLPIGEAGCSIPVDLSFVAANQRVAYEQLFLAPYDACEDLFLLIDEEVLAPDPDYVILGTRGDETFDLVVTAMVPFNDWEEYDLPPLTVSDLLAANATASVIRGVMDDYLQFMALTVSFDDPGGSLPRTHAIMLMATEPESLSADYNCPGNQEAFDECRDNAALDFHGCQVKADNDFSTCAWNDGAIGGGIGGFLGCVLGKIKLGGVGGPVAVKGILIGCGIGALVGAALAVWRCYNLWKNDMHDCYIDYDTDLQKCWLLCDKPIGGHEDAPPEPSP